MADTKIEQKMIVGLESALDGKVDNDSAYLDSYNILASTGEGSIANGDVDLIRVVPALDIKVSQMSPWIYSGPDGILKFWMAIFQASDGAEIAYTGDCVPAGGAANTNKFFWNALNITVTLTAGEIYYFALKANSTSLLFKNIGTAVLWTAKQRTGETTDAAIDMTNISQSINAVSKAHWLAVK